MEKNNIIVIAILFLLAFGIYLAFSNSILSDKTYGELLRDKTMNDLGPVNILLVALSLSFLTAVITYLALYEKENPSISFLVSILFLLSPVVLNTITVGYSFYDVAAAFLLSLGLFIYKKTGSPIKFASFLFFIAAFLISLPYFVPSVSNLTLVGMLLPLAALSLAKSEKNYLDESLLAFIAGAVFSFFSPGIAIIFLAFAADAGLASINQTKNQHLFWSAFAFVLVLSLAFLNPESTLTSALSLAVGFSILSYFLFFLFAMDMDKYKSFFMFALLALSAIGSSFVLGSALDQRATPSLVNAYQFSKTLEGKAGLIGFPNTYNYYSGKSGVLLQPEELVSERQLPVDYVILDSNGLYNMYGNSSIVFRFDSFNPTTGNPGTVLFRNSRQIAVTSLSPDMKNAMSDATVQDISNGVTRRVSFPKLKSFSKTLSLTDKNNLLINIENLGSSNLYNLLFRNQEVFNNNGTMIATVR